MATKQEKAPFPKKRTAIIIAAGVLVVMFIAVTFGLPYLNYSQAENALSRGEYSQAKDLFEKSGVKDSKTKAEYCQGLMQLSQNQYRKATKNLGAVCKQLPEAKHDYQRACYQYAKALLDSKDYENALTYFKQSGNYKDAKEQATSVTKILTEQKSDALWNVFIEEAQETASYVVEEIQSSIPDITGSYSDNQKTHEFTFVISDPSGLLKEKWNVANAQEAVSSIKEATVGLSDDLYALASDKDTDDAICTVRIESAGTKLFEAVNGSEQ